MVAAGGLGCKVLGEGGAEGQVTHIQTVADDGTVEVVQ